MDLTAEIVSSGIEGVAPATFEFTGNAMGGIGSLVYAWDYESDGIQDSNAQTPIHTFDEPGTYSVTLTVTDEDRNQAYDSLEITVTEPAAGEPELTEAICGPMDVAIALDNTGSMGGAIENIKSELPTIIDQAEAASSGDLRLGYLTFKDTVTVVHQFTDDIPSMEAIILATSAPGGGLLPEASDIAIENAIENSGGFATPWRSEATNILLVITDAPLAETMMLQILMTYLV